MNGDRETKCNQCIITLLGYITSLIAHMHLPTTCQANSIQFNSNEMENLMKKIVE